MKFELPVEVLKEAITLISDSTPRTFTNWQVYWVISKLQSLKQIEEITEPVDIAEPVNESTVRRNKRIK